MSGSRLRVSVNRDTCWGAGQCAFWAPATFDVDDDDHKVVLLAGRDGDDAIRAAAEACPSRSITVSEPPAEA